eukprot:m.228134 g.228134  ORF g.228134 m.228134 type:complete len:156 (-) comp13875_c1_seq7:7958-8425(-)
MSVLFSFSKSLSLLLLNCFVLWLIGTLFFLLVKDRLPKLTELKSTGIKGTRDQSKDDILRIQRENIILLNRLESIQTKGSNHPVVPQEDPVKHVASSQINRKKKQQATTNANAKFVRRLNNVKSTIPKGARARPGPPKNKQRKKKQTLKQPEWQG